VIPPDLFAVQFYLVAGVFSSIRNLENFKINRPAIGAVNPNGWIWCYFAAFCTFEISASPPFTDDA
jgi:hypothetical protein